MTENTNNASKDPYSRGNYGVCQHCDNEGRLAWTEHFGMRVCQDDAEFHPFLF